MTAKPPEEKITLTAEQVEAGNKTLRDLKNGTGEMQERMAAIEKQRAALESLTPQVNKVNDIQKKIVQKQEQALAQALVLGLPTGKAKEQPKDPKQQPGDGSGGIVVGASKEVKRQRYRFKSQAEKDKEAELKAAQDQIEKELQLKRDMTVLKMTQTDNAELKALYAELAELERDHAGETAALADLIRERGLKCSATVRDIAEERASLTRQKAELEKQQKAVIADAEREWKKTVSDAIKTDRPIIFLVTDVMAMRNWMIDGSPGLSAREQMHRLEYQQKIGRSEFAFVENLIVYSKNQERVVHCAKKDGKWDFATYYEQCSLEYAQEQFAKCQGRTVNALPTAPGESSFTTTTL